MVATARVIENVGVAAYLGAANLLTDPTLLTAAASIVTVESRHQTVLNIFSDGTAIPDAFDLPLLPQEVLAIAGVFISGCDTGIEGRSICNLPSRLCKPLHYIIQLLLPFKSQTQKPLQQAVL